MLFYLVMGGVQYAWAKAATANLVATSEALWNAYSILSFVGHPYVMLGLLGAVPLVALRKNRSYVGWLGLTLLLGHFALLVFLLPAVVPPTPHPGETPEECPSCGTAYYLSDYRADADAIFCSRCKGPLPRAT